MVVVGFNLSNQSIDGSASVARQVRERSAGGVRVLPVPMRVDDSKPEQAERRRARARSQFEGACGPILHSGELQYWREVEVKHLPNLAYEEVLIPFALPNFEPSVQKQAYERLAQEISGDRTLRFAPLPDTVRSQYMGAFTEVPAPPRLVRLVFEPQDRAYADWIRAELNANAVPCDFDPGPGDRAARTDAPGTFLVLMSSAMVSSPNSPHWQRTCPSRTPWPTGRGWTSPGSRTSRSRRRFATDRVPSCTRWTRHPHVPPC